MRSFTLRNQLALVAIAFGCIACSDPAKTYPVGGTVTGLSTGEVVLSLNGTTTLTVTTAGRFEFPVRMPAGTPYSVTLVSKPDRMLSTLTNGAGTVSGTVSDIAVQLEPGYQVRGTADGLIGPTVLRLNGGNDLTVTADGAFAFPTLLPSGAAYVVTVASPAPGQTAQVNAGTGTIADSDVSDIGLRGRNWTLPTGIGDAISQAGNNANDPVVAANANGDMVVAWLQYNGSDYQVFKSEFRGGVWTHPADVNDYISITGGYAQDCRVAMNDAGDTVISWTQWFGYSIGDRILKSEYRNGTWTHPSSHLDAISPLGQYLNESRVAMDNQGNTVICWEGYDGTEYQIFKSEYRNGAWSHPTGLTDNISVDGTSAYDPVVAIDKQGHAVIAWEQSDGTDYRIFKSEYVGGAWSHPTNLQDGFSPAGMDAWGTQVAASGQGGFAIVWLAYEGGDDLVYASTYAGGAWTHPTSANDARSPVGASANDVAVCMSANGDVVVAWAQYDGIDDDQIFKSEFRAGVWSDPADLGDFINPTGTDSGGYGPQVACDAQGNTVLVWSGWDNFGNYTYKSQYLNGAWTHPSSITDSVTPYAPNSNADDAVVAVDGLGNALIAQTAYDGNAYRIFFAYYR